MNRKIDNLEDWDIILLTEPIVCCDQCRKIVMGSITVCKGNTKVTVCNAYCLNNYYQQEKV